MSEDNKRHVGIPRLTNSSEFVEVIGIPRLTSTNEDYLEAIYQLGGIDGQVRSSDLAGHLHVSKASVNTAINTLKQAGLVKQPYYGGISLTESGSVYAAQILERHQVLCHFLIEVLGVAPQVAEEEACLMEHAICSDTLHRLSQHIQWFESQKTVKVENG